MPSATANKGATATTPSSLRVRSRPTSVAAPQRSDVVMGRACPTRWWRTARSYGLQHGRAHLEAVALVDGRRGHDPVTVDVGSVRRPQVFDVHLPAPFEHACVELRNEGVV